MPHLSQTPYTAVVTVAVAAVLILIFGRLVRRHIVRLTGSVLFGAAVAFGATSWVDGHRRAALAAAAHGHHPVSVDATLTAAFAVITLITTVIAFTVASLVHRRRGYGDVRHTQGTGAW